MVPALAACGGSRAGVSTTVDPLAVFPREATYVWDDAASSVPDEPRLAPLHLPTLVHEEVTRALGKRDYRRVAARPADYRLSFEIRLNTTIEADHSRSQIVLWLTLTEDDSGRNVWAGAGQAELHMGLTEDERRKRLRDALEEMLEKFPPEQRGD
jgi:hypothetical protein